MPYIWKSVNLQIKSERAQIEINLQSVTWEVKLIHTVKAKLCIFKCQQILHIAATVSHM